MKCLRPLGEVPISSVSLTLTPSLEGRGPVHKEWGHHTYHTWWLCDGPTTKGSFVPSKIISAEGVRLISSATKKYD